ncbi:response regulator transcription factor [Weissella koreensis]|uniref:response regulator transcription factor n=1 Tax=Weissella koreensis TaxID=165096 RepID=UPI0002175A7D|nr:response regulator transcription factor [Weissella koreensis]AEJ24164.1 response regulator [Weissella koreensis KACC 15510]MCZ9311487.1 response regulator transcription factor [Weissella koreensis]
MTTILVVDDEPAIVTLIKYNLEQNNFNVVTTGDGQAVIELVEEHHPDLILLDLMLPGVDGMTLTKQLRKKHNSVPIIMLTAMDTESDKVNGLDSGADDYLAKPFQVRELLARVKAVLRRNTKAHKKVIKNGRNALSDGTTMNSIHLHNLQIDLFQQKVYQDQVMLNLTPKEYDLLAYMMQHAGRTLDRSEMAKGAWGIELSGLDTRMVDMHLSNLRDKIEANPKDPMLIKTVRGFGYRFSQEESK